MTRLIRAVARNQILTAVSFIVLGFIIVTLKDIIISLFIAYILMVALLPFVVVLQKNKFPRILSVIIPYFATIALLVLIIFPLFPFFITQVQSLLSHFPELVKNAAAILGVAISKEDLQSFITSDLDIIGQNALLATTRVFSGLFSILTILVVSFYLLVDHEHIKQQIVNAFPKNLQSRVISIFTQIEAKLGAWVRGQIILSFFIGVVTWVALTAIGLPFALPLAILAGILEIIPTIGPILASIPAILIALSVSPTTVFIVILAYIIIQALENNLLVPKIMHHAVGLHPVIVILGVMIGARLMGTIGALLSLPILATLIILYENLQKK